MTKKTLALLLFLSFLLSPVFSQNKLVTIKGKIVAKEAGTAEFVTVQLKGTRYGDLTDANGVYEFKAPPGEYTLVLSSLVIKTKSYPIKILTGDINTLPDFSVEENSVDLSEIVVTGQAAPQSVKNSAPRVRVINNMQIEKRGASDIYGILATQPGIRIMPDPMLGETTISMKGGTGYAVKILLDGIPLIDRSGNKQSLSQIDVNSIEKIEIIEGAMSVIYGTDAMAGVINIITKQPTLKPTIQLSMLEESTGREYHPFYGAGVHYETLSGSMRFGKGFSVMANATRNFSGGWKGDKDESERAKKWLPKNQYIYGGKIGYQRDGLKLSYHLSYANEKITKLLNVNLRRLNEEIDQFYFSNRFTHNFQALWHVNEKVSFDFVASHQDLKRDTYTTIFDSKTNKKTRTLGESEQDKTGLSSNFLRLINVWKPTNKVTLLSGLEYQSEQITGDRVKDKKDIGRDLYDAAIFASAEWSPCEWAKLTLGGRKVFTAKHKAPALIPSIQTKFKLTDRQDLRISYAEGFRTPKSRELYFKFVNSSHTIIGDENLQPEYSNSLQASHTWDVIKKRNFSYSTELATYYNNYKNMIEMAPHKKIIGAYTFVNTSKVQRFGISFENKFTTEKLTASLVFLFEGKNNIYQKELMDRYEEKSTGYDYIPEVQADISYTPFKKTSFNFFYKYNGRRLEYMQDFLTAQIDMAYRQGYRHADLTMTQTIGKSLNLRAGIKNIFNVQELKSSIKTTNENPHQNSGGGRMFKGSGRSYFIGLNYTL